MLKIAIQKSGRLYDDSIKLLKECGIQLNNGNKQLKTIAENFPLEVYLKSEAILTANKNLSAENKLLLEKLLLRINAVKTAKNNKYIILNAPNRQLKNISSVLPGMKSPTVTPLAEEGWSSVQSVVN